MLLIRTQQVGPGFTAQGQLLKPIGTHLVIDARPVDEVLSADKKYLLVKQNSGITVIETSDWRILSRNTVPGGASLRGLLLSPEGKIAYSDAESNIHLGRLNSDGSIAWDKNVSLPAPEVGGAAYGCGLAWLPDGGIAVCSSRANTVVLIDKDGTVGNSIPVQACPFDIEIAADGHTAVVSCWGRKAAPGGKSAPTSGTDVDIDERGIASGGAICFVDLASGQVTGEAQTGLQPSQIVVQDNLAYVAEADSDVVETFDIASHQRVAQTVVKPDPALPFGSAPNALALSEDGKKLYVACGGNNAVAVLSTGPQPDVQGFFPTNWYPTALVVDGRSIYVGCSKGTGSRRLRKDGPGYSVYNFTGTVSKVDVPDGDALKGMTRQVSKLAYAPQILREMAERANPSAKPVPVPKRLGEPSVFKHVVFILKENRTYDQVFGDIKKGDGDARLTTYGYDVTPNLHALAEQFVLLDNYYCNGVLSADGHAWSMEANATSYFERSFGGWTRSYPSGDDPLSVSTSGFLWDHVLASGLSFRNYGEFDGADLPAGLSGFKNVYDAYKRGDKLTFGQNIGVDKLRGYSDRNYPGWNLEIPDQLRADEFLNEFRDDVARDFMPAFTIIYMPNDHTSGLGAGAPTPKAQVADNDLAVGRIVDALSHSKFWSSTCVFINEDDAQNGFDHVDGHRSICLVVSPYSKQAKEIKSFYNQTSVSHTMLRMLGVPPMNQMDMRSPLMTKCFTGKLDTTPYDVLANKIPLDQLNPSQAQAKGKMAYWIRRSKELNLKSPDASSDALFNRILWFAAKGDKPYPAQYSGPHGKGLKKRGLKLAKAARDADGR